VGEGPINVGEGLREFAEARKPKKLVVEVSDYEDDDVFMYETQHPELVGWANRRADAVAGLRDPFTMQQDEIRFD
jgi:hypothetical protein